MFPHGAMPDRHRARYKGCQLADQLLSKIQLPDTDGRVKAVEEQRVGDSTFYRVDGQIQYVVAGPGRENMMSIPLLFYIDMQMALATKMPRSTMISVISLSETYTQIEDTGANMWNVLSRYSEQWWDAVKTWYEGKLRKTCLEQVSRYSAAAFYPLFLRMHMCLFMSVWRSKSRAILQQDGGPGRKASPIARNVYCMSPENVLTKIPLGFYMPRKKTLFESESTAFM